jgi:hypothetical protein
MRALLVTVTLLVGCAGHGRPAVSPMPAPPESAPSGGFIRELAPPDPPCAAPADCSFLRSL